MPYHYYQAPRNIPTSIKQNIHAVVMHVNYLVITCNMEIPSVVDTWNKIHLGTLILNEFTSTYYYNKNVGF